MNLFKHSHGITWIITFRSLHVSIKNKSTNPTTNPKIKLLIFLSANIHFNFIFQYTYIHIHLLTLLKYILLLYDTFYFHAAEMLNLFFSHSISLLVSLCLARNC